MGTRLSSFVTLCLGLSVPSVARAVEPEKEPASNSRSDEWTIQGLRAVEVGAQLGYHRRLNAPPIFAADEQDALGGGVDVAAFLSQRFALTLGWERLGLGEERTGITDYGTAAVRRRADGAWLSLRMAPWSNAWLVTTVGLGVGMAWQHVSASGTLWPALEPGRPSSVTCSGTGSPAPALRVELGVSSPLGSGLSVFANGGLGVFAFGDGDVGACISGAGSTQTLAIRTGFSYAFDVGGGGG